MDIRHMVRNILLRNGKIKQILLNLFIHKEEKTYQQILRGSKVSERRKTVRKIQQKCFQNLGERHVVMATISASHPGGLKFKTYRRKTNFPNLILISYSWVMLQISKSTWGISLLCYIVLFSCFQLRYNYFFY